MSQNTEKYYLIFEDWSMDPNQWSMFLDSIAVLLAIFGVVLAFVLYKIQRNNVSQDAFEYFQSSLPELKQSIEKAIIDLREFNKSLDLDNIVNPILSATLNDAFLSKINLVHLNRFYKNNKKSKLSNFKQLLIDSNFFGDYHSYITKEVNYFRTDYLKEKNTFSKWHLFRSTSFFSTKADANENVAYQEFYKNWVSNFNQDQSSFVINSNGQPEKTKNKKVLVETQIKNLAQDILPYIQGSEKANEINYIAKEVVSAFEEMTEMKAKIRVVLEKDIARFEKVHSNIKRLIE